MGSYWDTIQTTLVQFRLLKMDYEVSFFKCYLFSFSTPLFVNKFFYKLLPHVPVTCTGSHNGGSIASSPLAGRLFIVIGAGGAGKALAYGAKAKGARVVIANRTYGSFLALPCSLCFDMVPWPMRFLSFLLLFVCLVVVVFLSGLISISAMCNVLPLRLEFIVYLIQCSCLLHEEKVEENFFYKKIVELYKQDSKSNFLLVDSSYGV